MSERRDGNLEFLNFLADISDPGTGQICPDKLGAWLNLSSSELIGRWHRSGHLEWAQFANDVLGVLDLMQNLTHTLAQTIKWYRALPISEGLQRTGDELVSVGRAAEVILALVECKAAGERSRRRDDSSGAVGVRRSRT